MYTIYLLLTESGIEDADQSIIEYISILPLYSKYNERRSIPFQAIRHIGGENLKFWNAAD